MIRQSLFTSRRFQTIYTILSLFAVGLFAIWWFNPQHIPQNFTGPFRILDIILFLSVSYVIWHPIIMDILTWTISSHVKDTRQQKPQQGLKVAFITTIVPASESVDLLHKCLPAMVKAKYPHDTWLLDEGNNPEVKELCKLYGVNHFSRNGITEYNTPKGKFTKTKGGNHNSWYEAHGSNYDIVAQIDTDFVPKSTFLTKTLGYFRDPRIAFVGTPQIYGNTKDSLIAQGADEQLYSFYGSVLRGLSSMRMTLLIGANHVIRVSALKSVNHYSAHITEDLLTGMKLHTNGWKSIYISQPLAIGEGPTTWESYFNQQLRWAYGCMDILFNHSFRLFTKMDFRQTIYYFFLQQHYFTGIAMALSIFLLSIYFAFGLRAADIDLFRFFAIYSIILLISWLMSVWLQRYNVYRKVEGKILWAGNIISIAAWPVYFLAFLSILIGKRLSYKVTPKGENEVQPKTSLSVFMPHIAFGMVALIGLISSVFTQRQSPIMILCAISTVLLMCIVPFSPTIVNKISITKIKIIMFAKKLYKLQRRMHIAHQNILLKLYFKKPSVELARGTKTPYTQKNLSPNEIVFDCFFLIFAVLISLVLYVQHIGFYSDDWAFLGNFTMSQDQSLLGLFQTATTPNTFMRPVQNFYDAFLFWLFGTAPLGYQLVNAAVLSSSTLLFYFVLKQLSLPRIITIAVPLVYVLLPNYSVDRFWYAAFQTNLSVMFYFLSLLTALYALPLNAKKRTFLKVISIVALILSALSYEVVLPLYILNALLIWNPFQKFKFNSISKRYFQQNHAVFIMLTFIALGYILIFKAMTTIRLEAGYDPLYIVHIMSSAFWVNYGVFGLSLPSVVGELISLYANTTMLLFAGILYFVTFWYLYYVLSRPNSEYPSMSWMGNLTMISFLIFILGYVIFFTNSQVGFSPTGIENRVAVAAAIGVAFTFVGATGWLSKLLLPDKLARIFFCIVVSLLCTGGFLVINALSVYWSNAYDKGQAVLSAVHQEFSNFPKNSTLILDGVCPYDGPAPVFEADWDLKGALQTHYKDPTLKADIVTPRLKVSEKGVQTQIYTFPSNYSYKNLFIYNYDYGTVHPINTEKEARTYFQQYNPDLTNGCPNGAPGKGVDIL
jgi:cellulose synthase/poly-beta-1,6-N-acetylglucosamine synthase-like glycosyltransferase